MAINKRETDKSPTDLIPLLNLLELNKEMPSMQVRHLWQENFQGRILRKIKYVKSGKFITILLAVDVSIILISRSTIGFYNALVGGYLLQYALSVFPLVKALEFSYMIVFAVRFSSSFLFLKLKEPEKKGRTPLGLFSILYRQKIPGSPSGGTIKMK